METRSVQGTRQAGERPRLADASARPEDESLRRRTAALLTAAVFALNAGLNLFSGEWVGAAFFLTCGFLFYKHREIDRWPKAARVLAIVMIVALSVAMFVRLIQRAKALG